VIKLLRISRAKGFFLFLSFLIATNLAILLDIPVLRQLLGFFFFTTIPGLLLLHVFKLDRLPLTEKIILSVGLSISFLMFFGLILNSALFALGYPTPLSTTPLIISFSVILLVLGLIAYKRNGDLALGLSRLKLSIREKAFLLLPAFFSLLYIFGMHLMNTTDNNTMLMILLFLIPAYAILVVAMRRQVPERVYPSIVFLTGIALLLMASLRSSHILGVDAHNEYYFFQMTFNAKHWYISGRSILDACLSISLLPAIYQSLLNIDSEYLFKILPSLLFSVSPLAVYVISRKYIGSFYAFLASFPFMSQQYFLYTTMTARTNIAVLFFAMTIMILFHDGISGFNKKVLFIIFAASAIVSHYSTSYVFFSLLLITWVAMLILPKLIPYKRKPAHATSRPQLQKSITSINVALFFVMLFFWYALVATTAFQAAAGLVGEMLTSLNEFILLESRAGLVPMAMGKGIPHKALPSQIEFVFSWAIIAFIAIGILSAVARYIRVMAAPGAGGEKANSLNSRIDAEFFMLSLACSAVLVLAVMLPHLSRAYGIQRVYLQVMVVLASFFAIGGITLFRFLKSRACWVLLAVLIPYFMCLTGSMYQIFNIHRAVILNSEGRVYDILYVHDEESYAAKWLQENGELGSYRVFIDPFDCGRLISQGEISLNRLNRRSLIEPDAEIGGYIYLGYYNVINGKLMTPDEPEIAELHEKFAGKGKVYSNGGSEIYK